MAYKPQKLEVAAGGTGAATLTNHGVLIGQGTSGIAATATGSSGQILRSGGASADPSYSTATYPATAGTAGKVLISDGTNIVSSTPTFPNASATSGKFIRSDGTNWIASTPTLPTSAGTSGKVLQSDGTNYVESTPTYPSTSGTSRKIIVSDGTNNVYSTETWAVPGTSGNVLTSDGTNWTSAAASGAGILKVSGSLTSAQIKALHGTPITVVAAQGAGTVIVPIYITAKFSYGGTNVFVAGASQTINLFYGTAVFLSQPFGNSDITGTTTKLWINTCGTTTTATYSSCANTALTLYNPVATEISGNAANNNTIPYDIIYRVVTI